MNSLENPTPKIVVQNIAIADSMRKRYKYMIIREVEGTYWFYAYANNLFLATRCATFELRNGLVIETENAVDVFSK